MSADLDSPYSLDEAQIRRFRTDGFIRLEKVLSEAAIAEYAQRSTASSTKGID